MKNRKKEKWCQSLIFLIALLMGISDSCHAAMPAFMERAYPAQKRARQAGFDKKYVKAGMFTLTTYERFKAPSGSIRIYIEGDGRAWETRTRLSDDPTPSSPIALELATADPSDAVVYIARPGQFPAPDSVECNPTYWSERRFAPEVVESFDKAIDILKKRSGARDLELIGYSGGAAIAVLVAARRSDVTSLRTVAGNLDPKALCGYHKVSALGGSMDPLDAAGKVAHIPQRHFVGSADKVTPPFIAESFVERTGDAAHKRITKVELASHKSGWREKWLELLSIPPQ